MIVSKDKCYICGSETEFSIDDKYVLYREATCAKCGAALRNSDLAQVIVEALTGKSLALAEAKSSLAEYHILNTCAFGPIHEGLKELPNYVVGEYYDGVKSGESKNGIVCVDLQNIPFKNKKFDLIITEDVFEHIEDIESAFKEINRVLKYGGKHIFTVPINENCVTKDMRQYENKVFHGDYLRTSGAIVNTDFGTDVIDLIDRYGMNTRCFTLHKFHEAEETTDLVRDYEEYLKYKDNLLGFFKYNSVVLLSEKTGDKVRNKGCGRMDFTGERYIPGLENMLEMDIEHIQRYMSVQKIVQDKVVLDIASGEGYGTSILAENAKRVIGMDICKEAIENAKRKYTASNIEFQQGSVADIKLENESVDVVVSFETIEHVDEEMQRKFLSEVQRVLRKDGIFIISSPNKEVYSDVFNYTNEFHVKEFYEKEFKEFLNGYFKYIEYYKQAFEVTSLLVKEKAEIINVLNANQEQHLESKYCIAICSGQELTNIPDIDTIVLNSPYRLLDQVKRIVELQDKNQELNDWGEKQDKDIQVYIENIEDLRKAVQDNLNYINQLEIRNSYLVRDRDRVEEVKDELLIKQGQWQAEKDQLQAEKSQLSLIREQLQVEKSQLELGKTQLEQVNMSLIRERDESKKAVDNFTKQVHALTQENAAVMRELNSIYGSTFWKVAKRYYAFRDGNPITRGIFTTLKHIKNGKIVNEPSNKVVLTEPSVNVEPVNNIERVENVVSDNVEISEQASNSKMEIELESFNYNKQDIIMLSVIDWNFRFQRPQQLAKEFAKLGQRVFYFNANFYKDHVDMIREQENLYSVTLSNRFGERIYNIDFEKDPNVFKNEVRSIIDRKNIRECTIIVEYPTWEPVARYLKEEYGFKVIFDYIDDYTGFEETSHMGLIDSTYKLLEVSDLTIATSDFLAEKAREHTDKVEIVRNGTEFNFFNKAYNPQRVKGKKIGYYGAIAEWFDIEKIEYIAANRPDIEIELIGQVSYEKCNKLKKYKNIKFLGEKPYNELPKYLEAYDVCLIPFRDDIDLIKATNPVKFYEYLSAGKKIVATDIPELVPFRDKYVYLAKNKEEFLDYVDMCIDNRDSLCSEQECIEFAETQDWKSRCEEVDRLVKSITPMVSIIVITYNNLHLTKQCINSIIEKTAYPNYEIVIVDNNSADETPDYLREVEKEHNNIQVILSKENTGFAGGNNIGIKRCKGDYIILLNNDTVVTRGWITGLIKHLDKTNIGMVGPATNSAGNESQIPVPYNEIKDMDKFAVEYTTEHHNELYFDIRVLAMFCVAIKRELVEKIGLLDENYLVGMFEDDDYSTAIVREGYSIACADDVFIHHCGRASFSKIEDERYKEIFEHNKKYYEEKWDTTWIPHKYRQG